LPLDPPPHDASGNVLPHDHEGILNSEGVIRRISANHIVDDPKTAGGRRLSSAAFEKSSGPNASMSVDLQTQIEEAGYVASAYVIDRRWIGAVRFVARDLREQGFQVGFDPLPENPFHGGVWGNFSRSRQKAMSEIGEWMVPITGVSIRIG
jgi:hypothetical protein